MSLSNPCPQRSKRRLKECESHGKWSSGKQGPQKQHEQGLYELTETETATTSPP